MKGAFLCPYCKTKNACNCETCRPFIKKGEYINMWTKDGENMICGKCNEIYSPDQSLEEEYKSIKQK
jgi:hypothetical protein